jgi:hypothetical protein
MSQIRELPSEQGIDRLVALLAPLARVTQPKVYGIERVPDDGSLLVGRGLLQRLRRRFSTGSEVEALGARQRRSSGTVRSSSPSS